MSLLARALIAKDCCLLVCIICRLSLLKEFSEGTALNVVEFLRHCDGFPSLPPYLFFLFFAN